MLWYVISKKQAYGPFSEHFLAEKYRALTLRGETLLRSIHGQETLTVEELFQIKAKPEIKVNDDDRPPPLPAEALKAKKQTWKKNNQSLIKYFAIGIVLTTILMFLSSSSFFDGSRGLASRPADLSLPQYKKLKKAWAQILAKDQIVPLMNKDLKKIWAVWDIPDGIVVKCQLESVDGQIMGKKVVAQTQGTIQSGLLVFDRFLFSTGSQLAEGRYQVQIERSDRPGLLKKAEWLLITMNEKLWKKKIEAFQISVEKNQNNFQTELEEKYRTLEVMAQQIFKALEPIYAINKTAILQQNIKAFEVRYIKEFGVFFSQFVEENENQYQSLLKITFPDRAMVLKQYSDLTDDIRKLGLITMGALDDLKRMESNLSKSGLARMDYQSQMEIKTLFLHLKNNFDYFHFSSAQDKQKLDQSKESLSQ